MKPVIQQELDFILDTKRYMQFPELFNSIDEPIFNIHDTGVTSRLIRHWVEKKLIDNIGKEGKWHKFSLVELVWIKIIKKLREFNCPIKIIKSLKDAVYEDFQIDISENKEQIEKVILEVVKSQGFSEQYVKQILESEEVKKQLSKFKVSLLKYLVLDVVILKTYYAIHFNAKNEFMLYKDRFHNTYMENEESYEFLHNSYMSVSITEIMSEFIIKSPIEISHKKLHLLTDCEANILQTIRSKEYKSVSINLDKHGKPFTITLTDEADIHKTDRLTKLITENSYGTITLTHKKGNIVHCINERKIKIENLSPDEPDL